MCDYSVLMLYIIMSCLYLMFARLTERTELSCMNSVVAMTNWKVVISSEAHEEWICHRKPCALTQYRHIVGLLLPVHNMVITMLLHSLTHKQCHYEPRPLHCIFVYLPRWYMLDGQSATVIGEEDVPSTLLFPSKQWRHPWWEYI